MPVVQPINLAEIKNVGIQDILKRYSNSCQHYSIVSTPRALKQGARFLIEKEAKIITKREQDAKNFQTSREVVGQSHVKQWIKVRDE